MAGRRSSGGREPQGRRGHSPWTPSKPISARTGDPPLGGRPEGHRRFADALAGLNLNAAVLLVPALYRSGTLIKGEEFANVAGRAGRAFVDVEGLIVHTMFDRGDWRTREWRGLVASAKARTLKSGLIQIVVEILDAVGAGRVLDRDDAWEYLANARDAWKSPEEEAALGSAIWCAPDADVTDADQRWRGRRS